MAGNVWEWTQDRWHGSYQGAPNDGAAWEEGGCGERVLRGGSWINYSLSARSACRYDAHPSRRSSTIGFRLVRTAPFPEC
jgi:formylglycine-generating enzyme required for sulfatase activity